MRLDAVKDTHIEPFGENTYQRSPVHSRISLCYTNPLPNLGRRSRSTDEAHVAGTNLPPPSIFRLAQDSELHRRSECSLWGSGFRCDAGAVPRRLAGSNGKKSREEISSACWHWLRDWETRLQTHRLGLPSEGQNTQNLQSCIARVLWLAALQSGFLSMKGASSQ